VHKDINKKTKLSFLPIARGSKNVNNNVEGKNK